MLTSAIHLPALGLDTLDVPTLLPFHPQVAVAFAFPLLEPLPLTLARYLSLTQIAYTFHHPAVDTAAVDSHPVNISVPLPVSLATSVKRVVSSASASAGAYPESYRRSMGHAAQLALWRRTRRSTRDANRATKGESVSGIGAGWRTRKAHVARRWFTI